MEINTLWEEDIIKGKINDEFNARDEYSGL